jgi:hypothetical protein
MVQIMQVLRAAIKALDDKKRAVRQEAVRCRQTWYVNYILFGVNNLALWVISCNFSVGNHHLLKEAVLSLRHHSSLNRSCWCLISIEVGMSCFLLLAVSSWLSCEIFRLLSCQLDERTQAMPECELMEDSAAYSAIDTLLDWMSSSVCRGI